MLIWDRNYNSYAFELIDSNHIPALQVLMGANNTISFGFSLFAQRVPDYFGITTGTYFGSLRAKDLQKIKSSTLFKYPSSDYPTEMLNSTEYPSSNMISEANTKVQLGHTLSIFGGVLIAIFGVGMPLVIAGYIKKPKTKRKA